MKVWIVKKKDRKTIQLRWIDPDTGAERQRSSGTTCEKEATKLAGKLEAELQERRYDRSVEITWKVARERFEIERLPQLKKRTQDSYKVTLNQVEKLIKPKRLADLNASRISLLQSRLAATGIQLATIHNRLTHLKAFLRWAEDLELILKAPKIRLPSLKKQNKLMRGRPITDDEFQKMLDAIESVVGIEAAESWKFYLTGVYLSGLRRAESIELSWDRGAGITLEMGGKYPMLLIQAEFEKGGKDRLLPITPDIAAHLEQVPKKERKGRVFKLMGITGTSECEADWAGRVVCRIGKAAGIIVDDRRNRKFASLHDLRRSFGQRWAERVPVHTLRELMRHESIDTTMAYYVGQGAQRTAELIWNK